MNDLQSETVAWATETFPAATPRSCLVHLMKELGELGIAERDGDVTAIAEEAADCVLLLMHVTGRFYGIDLSAAVRAKLEVNKARAWSEPDADGVQHHIKREREA